MELVEPIDYINEQLEKLYGREPYADDRPRFRVVFSGDQFEKRWTQQTKDGFDLLYPEVRELPKYRHYIQAKYVLERLVPIDQSQTDLTVLVGYEPAHVFMDSKQNYLPPRLDMCCVAIDALLTLSGQKPGTKKYNDPEIDPEYRSKEVDKMVKEIFGNETDTGDALAYQQGVVNPAGKEHFTEQTDSVKPTEKVDSNG